MSEHNDIAGQKIKPGQFVIYAALWDRCATLKYGVVTRLAERDGGYLSTKKVPTIRVISVDRSRDKWEIQKKGSEVALGFVDRLLVVPKTMVPAEALQILEKELEENFEKVL